MVSGSRDKDWGLWVNKIFALESLYLNESLSMGAFVKLLIVMNLSCCNGRQKDIYIGPRI
jgi:hypothetical protein